MWQAETHMIALPDVAALLGISQATLRCWEKAGRIPASVQSGARRFFDLQPLNKALIQLTGEHLVFMPADEDRCYTRVIWVDDVRH